MSITPSFSISKIMSKKVTITLTEKQFNLLKLCFMLGDFVKDSVEEKSPAETKEQMELFQLLDKSAYESKFQGSGFKDGIYYHGAILENEMMEIIDVYDQYLESGQKAEEMEAIRKQIEDMQ